MFNFVLFLSYLVHARTGLAADRRFEGLDKFVDEDDRGCRTRCTGAALYRVSHY